MYGPGSAWLGTTRCSSVKMTRLTTNPDAPTIPNFTNCRTPRRLRTRWNRLVPVSALGRAHATQYQSANSTVNSPSSGKEKATYAFWNVGRAPHSPNSANIGNSTSAKRGMLIRLAVHIGMTTESAM